jgi:hypothetical protein
MDDDDDDDDDDGAGGGDDDESLLYNHYDQPFTFSNYYSQLIIIINHF